ncbi:MAG: hypothetical protein HP492_19190 [Nitrospira sp.]|nr:hypothetical protein [Nitrospira sp.]
MPVNMDPSKKRRRLNQSAEQAHANHQRAAFGEETETDREKDLADAEAKNLWDATEVIDMDKI